MRVVLDANVFVSSLISAKGNPAKIVRWWLDGAYDVLVTQTIVDEIVRVTGYTRIQDKYAKVRENRLEFAALLMEQGVWIEPEVKVDVVINESDNRYLECAVAGGAQYIISGDEHLLALGAYEGIAILTSAAFVTLQETGYA